MLLKVLHTGYFHEAFCARLTSNQPSSAMVDLSWVRVAVLYPLAVSWKQQSYAQFVTSSLPHLCLLEAIPIFTNFMPYELQKCSLSTILTYQFDLFLFVRWLSIIILLLNVPEYSYQEIGCLYELKFHAVLKYIFGVGPTDLTESYSSYLRIIFSCRIIFYVYPTIFMKIMLFSSV